MIDNNYTMDLASAYRILTAAQAHVNDLFADEVKQKGISSALPWSFFLAEERHRSPPVETDQKVRARMVVIPDESAVNNLVITQLFLFYKKWPYSV